MTLLRLKPPMLLRLTQLQKLLRKRNLPARLNSQKQTNK
jgi:hypothetical protein